MSSSSHRPARLVLVGVAGYGRVHAARIATLQTQRRVVLVAAVDPVQADPPPEIANTPIFTDLADALAVVGAVDVVIIAAPIPAHAGLAELALLAGADVLLEKPPVASFADFTRLLEIERRTGRVVQVGFQSLGSHGLGALHDDTVGVGEIVKVTATAAWSRTAGYWARSPWAGRRHLGELPVVDGVVTNPLAHATATALAVVGCRTADDVVLVDADLYRANPIDGDDTSVVRIRTATGHTVTCAYTLCAQTQADPVVRVEGTRGRVDFAYTVDRLMITSAGQRREVAVGRDDLLENLLAFRRSEVPLLVPLASTGAFMRVLDAVARAEEPVRVDPRAITWSGDGADRRPVIGGIEQALARASETGRTFSELGLDWTHATRDTVTARGRIDDVEVLEYRDGAGTIATSTPRPYLHPVCTRGGVVVSGTHPADHDWHTGIGLAIPDVNGTNFWGGGTYVHGRGYALAPDHGVVRGGPVHDTVDGLRQRLDWIGVDGRLELVEERRIAWRALGPDRWRLTFATSLGSDHRVVLGSPGSKGRVGGGYGGFFWRFPRCADVDVLTSTARGEEAVHGSVAPWVAWSADFGAGPGVSGPATVVVASPDVVEHAEPWFVRVEGYAGLGSALAWDRPLVLAAGDSVPRTFEVLVIDGRLDAAGIATAVAELALP
ncbi:MAG: DUF6807 family protein [Propionibacteriaceae bacterium]